MKRHYQKHGLKNHPLYREWKYIIDYRGDIYTPWRTNFKMFYDWAIENGCEEGKTFNCIFKEDGFHPGNMRIVDKSCAISNTKKKNLTNNQKRDIRGSYLSVDELSIKYGVSKEDIYYTKNSTSNVNC